VHRHGSLNPASAQEHVVVKTIAPSPEDVSTIEGMMKAWYEIISRPAGQSRNWARDRTFYIRDLRFVQVDLDKQGRAQPTILNHQEYADRVDAAMRKQGFFEREIRRVTETYGPIAHLWSTYESSRTADGPFFARGINSIEPFWDGTRWWIANAVWTEESDTDAIPAEYLPSAKWAPVVSSVTK
jgi:hypothetical protein